MKHIFLLFLLLCFSCNDNVKEQKKVISEVADLEAKKQNSALDLEIYDYDGLEPLINKVDNKVHVVNFWATWCAPCVKELPFFEAVKEKYEDDGLEVLLVSLDFPKNYESKLIPYIAKHNLKSKVVALDDTDQNRWIPAINKDWSGAIPATIIYNKDKRLFFEKSFSQEELETEIQRFIK
ncbi:TlpA family protein disulfide reductase [Winogradskyella alexanderae]|uniref:TlpA family protein disulfide reductase n=1 Tax=Winogradskyella alexanderae TaxID=2877123 RepID=A0ABS7XS82_9FLAO|nr:TlpA family protein disulfide reductase [Winogradskyella alexanderae]MCA0132887.1 TlpA family protein disulfide reductase [Winogradskyella alexanderae]